MSGKEGVAHPQASTNQKPRAEVNSVEAEARKTASDDKKKGSEATPPPKVSVSATAGDGKSGQRLKPPPKAAPVSAGKTTGRGAQGLSDEHLSDVAEVKRDIHEEKLRDVARPAMVLLRDFKKMTPAECKKKVCDVRKALCKYEMQCIRMWSLQEKTSQEEVKAVQVQVAKCNEEAEEEKKGVQDLHDQLDKARQCLKRHKGYEELAAEVNRKKVRKDTETEIGVIETDIAKLRQHQSDLEVLVEQRNRRAQTLQNAVEELKQALQLERKQGLEAVGAAQPKEGGSQVAGNASDSGSCAPAAGTVLVAIQEPASKQVEVIS